jgi:hypothetical protein
MIFPTYLDLQSLCCLKFFFVSSIYKKKPHKYISLLNYPTRETIEGWPMLTVETEVNGDSKSTNERVLGWFVGLVVPVQEIFVQPQLL